MDDDAPRLLVTCPPMLGLMDEFQSIFSSRGVQVSTPDVVQTLSEQELVTMIPEFDGWIIGDDPATRRVFEAGVSGRLKAAVKWGVGVDNVDFVAARQMGVLVDNTPNMFGNEVADVAMGYVLGLARETYLVDRKVRSGRVV